MCVWSFFLIFQTLIIFRKNSAKGEDFIIAYFNYVWTGKSKLTTTCVPVVIQWYNSKWRPHFEINRTLKNTGKWQQNWKSLSVRRCWNHHLFCFEFYAALVYLNTHYFLLFVKCRMNSCPQGPNSFINRRVTYSNKPKASPYDVMGGMTVHG